MVPRTESIGPRILIAASGTGGHLFPALYIAQALVGKNKSCTVQFVGSGRPLEEMLISKNGFQLHTIPATGIKNRGIRGILQFIAGFPKACRETNKLVRDLKPHVVVGIGGYVTFFPILLGRFRGVKTWIHEAELRPGLANSVLSFFANKISVSHQETKMPTRSNVIFTGHPVRSGLHKVRSFDPIQTDPKKILLFGGSQGAEGLDKGMIQIAPFLKSKGLEVYHQCRKENLEFVAMGYKSAGVSAKVVAFIDDVDSAFRWADIIVSRSGAGSTMELGIVNKPILFVPFPYSQGDHQAINAMTLVNVGKALMEREGDGFAERLTAALEKLLDKEFYNRMKTAPQENRNVDAASRIADGILSLAESAH